MASSLIIEELTGKKRRLELRGGGLPKHGASFPSKQRVVNRFLPGARVATTQLLGPEEGSPSWDGSWSTPVLASLPSLYTEAGGAEQKIARARTLHDIVDAITYSGSRLRITWTQDDFPPIVREGRIEEYEPKFRTNDDIEWTITWKWSGRGESRARVISTKKDAQLAQHKKIETEIAKITAEVFESKLLSSKSGILGSASHFSLGDAEALVDSVKNLAQSFADDIQQVGSRIKKIADLVQSIEELPLDVATSFLNATATVISACASFKDQVTRKGPEAWTRFDQSSSIETIVNASRYIAGSSQAADDCIAAACDARSILLTKSGAKPGSVEAQTSPQPTIGAVVFARQGDTFASVAKSKIGDAVYGPAVAQSSGYAAFEVAPRVGDVLIVPTLARAKMLIGQ